MHCNASLVFVMIHETADQELAVNISNIYLNTFLLIGRRVGQQTVGGIKLRR